MSVKNIVIGILVLLIASVGFYGFYEVQRNEFAKWISKYVVSTHTVSVQPELLKSSIDQFCKGEKIPNNLEFIDYRNAKAGEKQYLVSYKKLTEYDVENYNQEYRKVKFYNLPFPFMNLKNVETTACFELELLN